MLGRVHDEAVIAVDDVRKAYGDVKAVDGVSFQVAKGEIFGLLGPNGAGKTTTMETLRQTMVGGTPFVPLWADFAVLGGWLVVTLAISARFFRWQ
jgi:ABC-type uncharacterized transport system YnjBCD ATPase subunit